MKQVRPKLYEGEASKDNMKRGRGRMQYRNGDVYEGEWKENCYYGKGFLKYQDGREYTGDWVLSKREGRGTFKYPDGQFGEENGRMAIGE